MRGRNARIVSTKRRALGRVDRLHLAQQVDAACGCRARCAGPSHSRDQLAHVVRSASRAAGGGRRRRAGRRRRSRPRSAPGAAPGCRRRRPGSSRSPRGATPAPQSSSTKSRSSARSPWSSSTRRARLGLRRRRGGPASRRSARGSATGVSTSSFATSLSRSATKSARLARGRGTPSQVCRFAPSRSVSTATTRRPRRASAAARFAARNVLPTPPLPPPRAIDVRAARAARRRLRDGGRDRSRLGPRRYSPELDVPVRARRRRSGTGRHSSWRAPVSSRCASGVQRGRAGPADQHAGAPAPACGRPCGDCSRRSSRRRSPRWCARRASAAPRGRGSARARAGRSPQY